MAALAYKHIIRGDDKLEIKFSVYHEMLEHFTNGAKKRLKIAVENYIKNIIEEAAKIENAYKEGDADLEITESSVITATKNRRTIRRKSKWKRIGQLINTMGTLLIGVFCSNPKLFFNSDRELNTMYVAAFLITIVMTVVAAGYVYFIEE